MIEDSESDAEIYSALPDTLEEFIPDNSVKPKSKSKKIAVTDDDEDYVSDHSSHDERATPAKKAKVSKPKIEKSTESTEESSTPKKKFKYKFVHLNHSS